MNFESQIRAFNVKAIKQTSVAFERICVKLHSLIVSNTPIDTGQARANWNMSIGNPDISTTKSIVRSEVYSLLGVNPTSDNVAYVANGLHYIYDLEHGKSNQAPSGMVAISMAEVKSWIHSGMGITV